MKDFCAASVSLLPLEVFAIFEKYFAEVRTCSKLIVSTKLVLRLFVTITHDVNVEKHVFEWI